VCQPCGVNDGLKDDLGDDLGDDWDPGVFWSRLAVTRERVDQRFRGLFAEVSGPEVGPHSLGARLWLLGAGEVGEDLLTPLGFRQSEGTAKRLADLRRDAVRSMSREGRARLDRLMPTLLDLLAGDADADRTLERVLRLIRAVLRRSAYLALLNERTPALRRLLKLCAQSGLVAERLAQTPALLDELLASVGTEALATGPELGARLSGHLATLGEGDLEARMEAVRLFQQRQVLRIAVADLEGRLPLPEVSNHLTELAERCLAQAATESLAALRPRHGQPPGGLGVVGYGKLGGLELGYASDLDLVLLFDAQPDAVSTGDQPIPAALFYARAGQRFLNFLSARTASGVLYEVDTRLRPDGSAGQLVASLDGYAEYLRQKAWVWELQALVRSRLVYGSADLSARFEVLRKEILCQPRDPELLRQAVREMREKMRTHLDRSESGGFDLKRGLGGITDIEFWVQYQLLALAHTHPGLVHYSDNKRQLEALAGSGAVPEETCRCLWHCYEALRTEGHHRALQGEPAQVPDVLLREERDYVRQVWAETFLDL